MRFRSARIRLVSVGRLKEPHWRQAQSDYLRRLKFYAPVEVIEVKDRVGSGVPDAEAMRREGDDLLAASRGYRLVALTPEGETLSQLATRHRSRSE